MFLFCSFFVQKNFRCKKHCLASYFVVHFFKAEGSLSFPKFSKIHKSLQSRYYSYKCWSKLLKVAQICSKFIKIHFTHPNYKIYTKRNENDIEMNNFSKAVQTTNEWEIVTQLLAHGYIYIGQKRRKSISHYLFSPPSPVQNMRYEKKIDRPILCKIDRTVW